MAFVVPGVQGKPIAANNFTRRFRANPNIVAWLTLQKSATFDDGSGVLRMIPRKGAHLATCTSPATAAWEQFDPADPLEFYNKIPENHDWVLSAPYSNVGNDGFGLTLVFKATAGNVEPGHLRFAGGNIVFPQPLHGDQTGPFFRSGTTNTAGFPSAATPVSLGAVAYVNMSYRYSDRRLSWQAMGDTVEQHIAPAEWGLLADSATFDMVVGRANFAQQFQGVLYDAAIWRSDFLDDEDSMSLVSEYVASTYGV